MNLLTDNQPLVITDFLYYKGQGGQIFAERCEIYKGIGLFLYRNHELIFCLQDKIEEVRFVTITDTKAHYYIKGKDFFSAYLVTADDSEATAISFQIGDVVVEKGDLSFGLTIAGSEQPDFFERFQEELKRDVLCTIKQIKAQRLLEIELPKEGTKWIWSKDVIRLDEIKENAKWYKSRHKGMENEEE